MKIQRVDLAYIHQIWGVVANYLAPAMQYAHDDYTLEQIKVLVTSGQWILIVAVDDDNHIQGAMTVHLFNRPNDRVAFITATGGKHIISPDTFDQLKEIVVNLGATYIEAAGRESVVKLLSRCGMHEKYRIVGTKL